MSVKPVIIVPLVAGIGNAILAEPMLRQLCTFRPEYDVVVSAGSRPIAEAVERVPGVTTRVTGGGMKNLLRGVVQNRHDKADVFLVPFPSNRWQYNLLAAASGAKRVIIHNYPIGRWSAMGFLHNDRVSAERGLHDVTQNLRLLTALSITPDYTAAPQFPLRDDDTAPADELLTVAGVNDRPFVVIHAGSARTVIAEAKRWSTANYALLAERIRDELSLDVLIVEGPDEVGVAEAIFGHMAHPHRIHAARLHGKLSLAASVLARAQFYVGTDSGLAHLAAAVGRPAVTLFCPADPDRVCPFGQRDRVVQPPGDATPSLMYPWESTRPKMRFFDRRINSITVESVMAKVTPLLSDPVSEAN